MSKKIKIKKEEPKVSFTVTNTEIPFQLMMPEDFEQESKWTQLKKALFYDYTRTQLSRTALMSFIIFALTVLTWIPFAGVTVWSVVYCITKGIAVPTALISAFFAWTGGGLIAGFANYSYGKKISK